MSEAKTERQTTHVLERTSPIGQTFLGRCLLCGEGPFALSEANQPCSNPTGETRDGALLRAIRGDDE